MNTVKIQHRLDQEWFDNYCQDKIPDVVLLSRDLAPPHHKKDIELGPREDIWEELTNIWIGKEGRLKIAIVKQSMEERFTSLKKEWEEHTMVLSSPTAKAMHPSYQSIIGMGYDVVKYLLCDLQSEPNHWFWALKAITGCDPVPPEDVGDVERMSEAWINWGRESGIIN